MALKRHRKDDLGEYNGKLTKSDGSVIFIKKNPNLYRVYRIRNENISISSWIGHLGTERLLGRPQGGGGKFQKFRGRRCRIFWKNSVFWAFFDIFDQKTPIFTNI